MRTRSLIVLLFLFSFSVKAQETITPDSVVKRKWYVPDGYLAQYAGGVGMISVGATYDLTKRIETEFIVGYTPPEFGNIWTTNLFTSITLAKLNVTEQVRFSLKAGVFLNYNIGDHIYLKWPEQYPKKYYWWNSAMRFGPFMSVEGMYVPSKGIWNYAVFLQCNTNDLYLYAYRYSYDAVPLSNILVLGTGIRMELKAP